MDKENGEPREEPSTKKQYLSLSLKGKLVVLLHQWKTPTCPNYVRATLWTIHRRIVFFTNWAGRVFYEWRSERISDVCDEECPDDLLESPSAEAINYWLSRFVVECRHRDGEHYPPTTLYQLLAGLLRYSRSKSKDCPNFLDKRILNFEN